jgi:hypothetical protein
MCGEAPEPLMHEDPGQVPHTRLHQSDTRAVHAKSHHEGRGVPGGIVELHGADVERRVCQKLEGAWGVH